MTDILERLEKWRLERGLDRSQGFEFDLNVQMSYFFEEIGVEFLRAKTEDDKIDAYCDTIVFCYNGANLFNYTPKYIDYDFFDYRNYDYKDILQIALDILYSKEIKKFLYSEILSISKIQINKLGYDYDKCMEETLKEIESRKGAINKDTGKWEKFKDEESKKLWYKADFKKCKLKG